MQVHNQKVVGVVQTYLDNDQDIPWRNPLEEVAETDIPDNATFEQFSIHVVKTTIEQWEARCRAVFAAGRFVFSIDDESRQSLEELDSDDYVVVSVKDLLALKTALTW